jgi:ribA/ribD-fused uncharacterized protein
MYLFNYKKYLLINYKNMNNYYQKYLKYKTKYLNLIGGGGDLTELSISNYIVELKDKDQERINNKALFADQDELLQHYSKVSTINFAKLVTSMNNKKIYYFFGKDIDYNKDLIGKTFDEREAKRTYFSNFKIVKDKYLYKIPANVIKHMQENIIGKPGHDDLKLKLKEIIEKSNNDDYKINVSEKAVMLSKAALFGDYNSFEKILGYMVDEDHTQKKIQDFGREVLAWNAPINIDKALAEAKGIRDKLMITYSKPEYNILVDKYLDDFDKLWKEHIYDIAYHTILQKFDGCKGFRDELLNQKDNIIVEASPYDNLWGSGLSTFASNNMKDPFETLKYGKNILGLTLMRVANEKKNKMGLRRM